jgi:hypothetical protein
MRVLSLTVVICTWIPSLAFANNNVGLKVIPFHITNNLNRTEDLYVWIRGVTNSTTASIPINSQVYVTNAQGDVAINPAVPANLPTSFSINVGPGKDVDLMLPKLSGVRIYLSLGAGLLTQNGGVAGAALATPDVENPGDPNFNTIFDSTELTWEHQAAIPNHPEVTTNLGINVTEVDLFGLPQQFTIQGLDPATFQPAALSAGFRTQQRRPDLLNKLLSFGPPWSNLIVANRARAISPNHAIHATIPPLNDLFPADQLDDYINQVFQRYMNAPPLTTTVTVPSCDPPQENCPTSSTYNFSGAVAGGEFVFSDPAKGGAIFSFAHWSTFNAYEGSFPYGSIVPMSVPDILAANAVAAKLQGALMRTTLIVNSNLDACVTSQFYVNPPVNMYAKLWHDAGKQGKAYGFGFDDTCDQSSFKLIFNPTKLTITLLGNRP